MRMHIASWDAATCPERALPGAITVGDGCKILKDLQQRSGTTTGISMALVIHVPKRH